MFNEGSIPASIAADDLAEVKGCDHAIKALHSQLGQLEHQQILLDEEKAQAKAQLGAAIREQMMANKRLMKRYNLPEGTAVDLETGAVIVPH